MVNVNPPFCFYTPCKLEEKKRREEAYTSHQRKEAGVAGLFFFFFLKKKKKVESTPETDIREFQFSRNASNTLRMDYVSEILPRFRQVLQS